ncbi:hypothetical protein V8D89_009428 [Ganoderma adspersum]
MSADQTHSVPCLRERCLGICDLPIELLILAFSLLYGQDIARSIGVCRYFADLINSDVYLQYRIELARNGMVDRLSSTLPVSERLQRLRQYSSCFCNGIFNHETLYAHPDYVRQFRSLEFNSSSSGDASILYGNTWRSQYFLSVFTHGSAQAGIQSRRWLVPVGTLGGQTRLIKGWAFDRVQDLIVTVEDVRIMINSQMRTFLEIRFCSLSGSEATQMDHPAAMIPCMQVLPPPGSGPIAYSSLGLTIWGHYVVWKSWTSSDGFRYCYLVEVANWRTGQIVLRIDFGTQPIDVVPWGDSHLLVLPTDFKSPRRLYIYSLFSAAPNLPLQTLQLPEPVPNPGEQAVLHKMTSSLHSPTPEGHFHADPSRSIVLLTRNIRLGGLGAPEYACYLIIPYATLRTHIDAAIDSTHSDSPQPLVPVPWEEWGPRGCLQLRLPPIHEHSYHVLLVPSCSRMPVVVLDDPSNSVYVFEFNPLSARYASAQNDGSELTAIVEDVEAVLPGVVDPECAAIPYVVYRFALPPSERSICKVQMSMTGFAVTYEGFGINNAEETWTV